MFRALTQHCSHFTEAHLLKQVARLLEQSINESSSLVPILPEPQNFSAHRLYESVFKSLNIYSAFSGLFVVQRNLILSLSATQLSFVVFLLNFPCTSL